MPRAPKLRSLDLFSGIGGITHALHGIATPVAYCEKDPKATDVLKRLVAGKKLPAAPVHPDIQDLKGADLRGKVDIIVAGVPCVGFSSAGLLKGFKNDQSALYEHVVRLVSEIRPPFVFLENVPGIVKLGIRHVAKTLGGMGYKLWWVVLPAWSVGAPQKRSRWFCLAVRPEGEGREVPAGAWDWYAARWAREPVPRMVLGTSQEPKRRVSMLGNSVVPDCVRMAFLLLWSGISVDAGALKAATRARLAEPKPGKPGARGKDPQFGMCLDGSTIQPVDEPTGLGGRPALGLVAVPGDHTVATRAQSSGLRTTPVPFDFWGTPRHAIGYVGTRALTNRSRRDLATQLRFERGTPADVRDGFTNPQFVEWIMGFPIDWTL